MFITMAVLPGTIQPVFSCPQRSQMKHVTALYSTETSSTTKVSFISWGLACFRPVVPSHPSPNDHGACACLLVKCVLACKATAMLLSYTHMTLYGAHQMHLAPQIRHSGTGSLKTLDRLIHARLELGLRSGLAKCSLSDCTARYPRLPCIDACKHIGTGGHVHAYILKNTRPCRIRRHMSTHLRQEDAHTLNQQQSESTYGQADQQQRKREMAK